MSNPSRRVLVVSNPTAGSGRSEAASRHAVDRLEAAGHDVGLLQAASYAELVAALDEALTGRVDALVVVGGDGMVSLAINALREYDIPLGIIPTGTGNDFVRGLGLSPDDEGAAIDGILRSLATGGTAIDLAEATGNHGSRLIAGSLNASFDALVNARSNAMRWPRGSLRYVIATVRELIRFTPLTYTLTVDGVERVSSSSLLTVANNGYIGGGMNIVPDASLTDGTLELFAVTGLPRLKFLLIFATVFRGTHVRRREVSIESVREVTIAGTDIVAYADGEPVGALPVTVRVLPGAQRVLY